MVTDKLKTVQQKQDNNETIQSDGGLLLPETTYDASIVYVKKLIMLGISNIAYLRTLMPDRDFTDRTFEDIRIKILSKKSKNEDAQKMLTWMKGAFEALDKKYLKSLTLSVYEDSNQPDKVLETYEFNIEYTDAEASMTLNKRDSLEKIRFDSRRLIRAIYFISASLPELPKELSINMRLLYNDEITPDDYEPAGFKPCAFDEFRFKTKKVKIDAGNVDMRWASLHLNAYTDDTALKKDNYIKTDSSSSELADDQLVYKPKLTQENVTNTSTSTDLTAKIDKLTVNEDIEDEESTAQSDVSANEHNGSMFKKTRKIDCECGNLHKDKQINSCVLFECERCLSWQHCICYRQLIENQETLDSWLEQNRHYCLKCCIKFPDEGLKPTDQMLIEKKSSAPLICIFRQLVYHCHKSDKDGITVKQLVKQFNITEVLAKKMLQKLVEYKIVSMTNQEKGWAQINRSSMADNLNLVFPNHSGGPNNNYVDHPRNKSIFNNSESNDTSKSNLTDNDESIIPPSDDESAPVYASTHNSRRSRSRSPEPDQKQSKKRAKSSDVLENIKKVA